MTPEDSPGAAVLALRQQLIDTLAKENNELKIRLDEARRKPLSGPDTSPDDVAWFTARMQATEKDVALMREERDAAVRAMHEARRIQKEAEAAMGAALERTKAKADAVTRALERANASNDLLRAELGKALANAKPEAPDCSVNWEDGICYEYGTRHRCGAAAGHESFQHICACGTKSMAMAKPA